MRLIKSWPQYTLMIVIATLMMAPLWIMFVNSFKSDELQVATDLGSFSAFFFGGDIGFDNYRQILTDPHLPFLRFLGNTVFIVFGIVGVGIIVNSMAAYALARSEFKGRAFILAAIILLIIIPLESIVIPLLLMVNKFGWIDSYHVQIIPFIAHPFSIFLFYQFFSKLPKDLDEAAKIDGASFFQVYWRIIMPISLPVTATVAILQSLEYWNSFLWPLMVTRGVEFRPLSVSMQVFFGNQAIMWGDVFAYSVLTSLPVLIFYLFFQRWFIQSVVGSSIKG